MRENVKDFCKVTGYFINGYFTKRWQWALRKERYNESRQDEEEEKRMSNIVLKNVCKSYDKEHYAVQDFSLERCV